MRNHDFLWYLDRTMRSLRAEVPEAHRALIEVADGLRIALRCDSAAATVWITNGRMEIFEPRGDADIAVAFDERLIIDLIDGRAVLHEAVEHDRLALRGSEIALERLLRGLGYFVRGAIRSGGMQSYLSLFRDDFGRGGVG